jgi:hypothetical protein
MPATDVKQLHHCLQAIVDTVETLLPRYLGKQPLDASNGLLEPLQTAYDAMAGTLGSKH